MSKGEPKYCNCGRPASWLYVPGFSDSNNDFMCDYCVPRGCSCQTHHLGNSFEDAPTKEDGIENRDWKWIIKDLMWAKLDGEGREFPCVEFEYDTEGNNFKDL